MRRIIGCAVIGSIVLWRVFVLDDSWFSPAATGFDLLLFILFLAPATFFIGTIVFLGLWLFEKVKLAEMVNFFCSVMGWALSGFGIASAIVIAVSAYYHSPQGPFSIVFLDGPLGAGIGTVVGLVQWLLNVNGNLAQSTRL